MEVKVPTDVKGEVFSGPELLEAASEASNEIVELLRRFVEVESPSGDGERIRTMAEVLADAVEERGGRVEVVEAQAAGVHLVGRFSGKEQVDGGPLLVLGHMDTVHPVGTLADMPFRVEGDKLRGPGVYDMKGGLVTTLAGLDLLRSCGLAPRGDLTFLVTCDEEVGSKTSRELIEQTARGARAALVPEPCVPGGKVKTRRKGAGSYRILVQGRAAHAGIEPEAGANSIHELFRTALDFIGHADSETGTTLSVGVVEGGTRSNVIAARASCTVDVRFWTREEAERVQAAAEALKPSDGRCRIAVEGGVNRMPLERTAESRALYDVAAAEARAMGFELGEGGTGGASDGNFTSAVGCPTLDGLGPDGGGAHSVDEHVLLDDLPRRAALMAALFRRL